MKKLFLLSFILLVALLINPVNAQVQIGVQAGLNITDLNMDLSPEGFKTTTRTRLIIGGLVTYNFIPLLGLQLEPAYVQKGATVNFSVTENNLTADIEGTISANYFDIPLLLKLSLPAGLIKPYLLAGGSVGFLLGDAKLKIDKATVNGQDAIGLIPSEEREQILKIKNKDYIVSLGAGIEIPVGLISVLVEGRYDIGLTNLNDDPNDDTEYKTTGVQLKAGILVGL